MLHFIFVPKRSNPQNAFEQVISYSLWHKNCNQRVTEWMECVTTVWEVEEQ
jgi:hypothetical protein